MIMSGNRADTSAPCVIIIQTRLTSSFCARKSRCAEACPNWRRRVATSPIPFPMNDRTSFSLCVCLLLSLLDSLVQRNRTWSGLTTSESIPKSFRVMVWPEGSVWITLWAFKELSAQGCSPEDTFAWAQKENACLWYENLHSTHSESAASLHDHHVSQGIRNKPKVLPFGGLGDRP